MRKILIISHNPMNQFDNMGKTIGNVFSKFKSNELCQLYFKEQNVSSLNCNNFFCIDDVSMLKSVFNRFYKTGKVIKNNTVIEKRNEMTDNVFEYGRKRNGFSYLFRDLVWKIGKWNTKELNNWIIKNKITSIFLFAGDYNFPINIALYLAQRYNVPLYVYFVDEYYRKNIGKQDILSKFHKLLYRKKINKIVRYSEEYFCISEAMRSLYKNEFKKSGTLLMNTTDMKITEKKNKTKNKKIILSYIGGLDHNRWKSLIDIAEVIYDNKLISAIELNVYSGETNKKVIEKLKNTNGLNYNGRINSEEVKKKIEGSDILLHVESFEKLDMDQIKYSVSTKIPDSLASGKLLLAYGPSELESIDYIARNKAGVVINEKNKILAVLNNILNNNIKKAEIIDNAIDLVKANHTNNIVYKKLNKILR